MSPESPSNPTTRLQDLEALGQLSQQHGTTLAVDATFASPFHLQTLAIPGVDIAIQAGTKYLGL